MTDRPGAGQAGTAAAGKGGWPRLAVATAPLLPLAVGYGLGNLAVALPVVVGGGGWLALAIGMVGVVLPPLFLAAAPGWRCLGGWFAGVGLTLLHLWAPWQSCDPLLERPCRAALQGVVVDAFADPWPWAPEGHWQRVEVGLRRLRREGEEDWQACRGRIQVLLPADQAVRYGDWLEATGTFDQPAPPSLPGQFDYRTYLLARGIWHQCFVETVERIGPARGWRRGVGKLLAWRARRAESLACGFRNDRQARATAAMTLGYRGALSPSTRQAFLRSGALHIFAISGLHVGIAAGLLVWVLRVVRLPFSWRYWCLPVVLGVYVFLTGGAPSAVRAWVMISVVCCARALLHPVSPLNGLSLAALVLLLVNPLSLYDVGFQFSFVIVAVLSLGWRQVGEAIEVLFERARWRPRARGLEAARGRVLAGLVRLAACSGLAWLGSAGLVAWKNGLVIPAALWVNLGVGVLAWLSLSLAAIKMLVGLLLPSWSAVPLARLLELLLTLIEALVDSGQRGCLAVPRPPAALVLLYYGCLMALLAPRLAGRWRAMAAGLLLVSLAGFCGLRPGRPAVVLLYGHGHQRLAATAAAAPGVPAVAVLAGDYRLDSALVDVLRHDGHGSLQAVCFRGGGEGAMRVLDRLDGQAPIERIVVASPAHARQVGDWLASRAGGRPKLALAAAEIDVDMGLGLPLAFAEVSPHRFGLRLAQAGHLLELRAVNLPESGSQVQLAVADQPPTTLRLPAALRVELLRWSGRGGGKWWARQGSNLRPGDYESPALTD